jgi:hypothetical protein
MSASTGVFERIPAILLTPLLPPAAWQRSKLLLSTIHPTSPNFLGWMTVISNFKPSVAELHWLAILALCPN